MERNRKYLYKTIIEQFHTNIKNIAEAGFYELERSGLSMESLVPP